MLLSTLGKTYKLKHNCIWTIVSHAPTIDHRPHLQSHNHICWCNYAGLNWLNLTLGLCKTKPWCLQRNGLPAPNRHQIISGGKGVFESSCVIFYTCSHHWTVFFSKRWITLSITLASGNADLAFPCLGAPNLGALLLNLLDKTWLPVSSQRAPHPHSSPVTPLLYVTQYKKIPTLLFVSGDDMSRALSGALSQTWLFLLIISFWKKMFVYKMALCQV